MKKIKNSAIWVFIVLLSIVLSSCGSTKKTQKNYKDYQYKTTQFDQKKYKIRKNFPPVQRYYAKNSLFRPRK